MSRSRAPCRTLPPERLGRELIAPPPRSPPAQVAIELVLRKKKQLRGVPDRTNIELLTGLQAGLCIGVGNASLASGLQVHVHVHPSRVHVHAHVHGCAWGHPPTTTASGFQVHARVGMRTRAWS